MTGVAASRAVRLDTWRAKARIAVGLAALAALVVLLIAAAVRSRHTSGRVVLIVFAGVLLALFVAIAVGGWYAAGRRALVFSEQGVAYASRRRPWEVGWSELVRAEVAYGWQATNRSRLLRTWTVRFLMYPHDPEAFAARHPQLRVYRGRFGAPLDGWSFALGPARELVEPLGAGLREFAGAADGGVVDLGRIRGGFL